MVICAVILLNAFRDMDVSIDDVRGIMRPKRHLVSTGSHLQRNSNVTMHFDGVSVERQESKDFSSNYGSSENDFVRKS